MMIPTNTKDRDAYRKGWQAAEREINDDGWTVRMAQLYVSSVGAPTVGDDFDLGFFNAVRTLAETGAL